MRILAFVTAYLKAHYPVDFMAALLTSETGNVGKVVKYINECREMNIRVLPPDVNASDYTFTPVRDEQGDAIRFGLGAVKNVGAGRGRGDYQGARRRWAGSSRIYQFCEHADMQRDQPPRDRKSDQGAARWIRCRARARSCCWRSMAPWKRATRAAKDRDSGQGGLFGDGLGGGASGAGAAEGHDWTPQEKLQGEKEMLGFYVTGHPLDSYEEKICELATHDSSELEGLEKGAEVALCGMLTGIQKRRNREGKPWASMVH